MSVSREIFVQRSQDAATMQAVYHELGHLYLALLFEAEFEVSQFAIGTDFMSQAEKDKDYRARIMINFRYQYFANFLDPTDKYVCILMAGLCCQNLHFIDKAEFEKNIPQFLIPPFEKMNRTGAIPDYEIAQPYIIRNATSLNKSSLGYIREILAFNFSFLSKKEVWKSIEEFAEIVLKKEIMVLDSKEITEIANRLNVNLYLEKNREEILKLRYPI